MLVPPLCRTQASVTISGGSGDTISDSTRIVLPSTTSLNVSPSPSALGQQITLLATVPGSAIGSVSFYDGGIPLGSAPIVSGHASLSTRLPAAGAHTFRAFFPGDLNLASSAGTAPHTVVAFPATGFRSPLIQTAAGSNPFALAAGDFNGDGKTDLVTANIGPTSSISILLGNGDGTFRPHVDYAAGSWPVAVVVADFNRDGKADIASANTVDSTISIFYGNGDGTFQPAISYPATFQLNSLAVGDFNGDGIPDLILGDGEMQVLFGRGDGSFFEGPTSSRQNSNFSSIVVTDLNRDGRADVMGTIGSSAALLGNGDGTFSQTYSGSATVVAVGDFNNDGKADLAYGAESSVAIALGNGDGTFQSPRSFPLDVNPFSLAVTDVDGDGKVDLLASSNSGSRFYVFKGNGDGTLQSAQIYDAGLVPTSLVTGDFNGDGRTDVALAGVPGVSVVLGFFGPILSASLNHSGDFYRGETGATYTIVVTNLGPGITGGTVTVAETLPAELAATAISGSGWNCVLATVTCTRSNVLSVGAAYPPITVTVNVSPVGSANVMNSVMASGVGLVSGIATDPTKINALPPPALTAPASGATEVLVPVTLSWGAVTNATSYDVYFGRTNPPPFLANTNGISYAPAAISGATYYWQIVAKNAAGSGSSPIWSFSVRTTGISQPSKVGIFRNGQWHLDLSGTAQWSPATDLTGGFGLPGDIPVVGDWDGSGKTRIGVFRNGQWHLDLSGTAQWSPATDLTGGFGLPGDIPVVGDWDGSGRTKVGVFRDGQWHLDLSGTAQWSPATDLTGGFGLPGDIPVVGDWDGSGKTKVGVFRNGTWFLDLSGTAQWSPGTALVGSFGLPGDIPVVGDWDGSGKTKVGVFRNGTWFLDLSGTAQWNPATTLVGGFGLPEDRPVNGHWN